MKSTETVSEKLIPRLYAKAELMRLGIEPTTENIDKYIWAARKTSDEDGRFCSECGKEKNPPGEEVAIKWEKK